MKLFKALSAITLVKSDGETLVKQNLGSDATLAVDGKTLTETSKVRFIKDP